MLEAPAKQSQLWVVQRLVRICESLRRGAAAEPCLEQYEQHVAMVMDEPVTPAASAWIQLIVQSLRQDKPFSAEDYLN